MLVRGPPPLVVVGCDRKTLDLVCEHFPGLFKTPLQTTTRPPMRGERPGFTVDFTTVGRFQKDADAKKFFEWGSVDDDDDGLTGTALQSIAHTRAMSQVPLLSLSMERAMRALTCPFVEPRAYSILVMTRQMEQTEAAERLVPPVEEAEEQEDEITVGEEEEGSSPKTVETAASENKHETTAPLKMRLTDRFDKVLPSGHPPEKIVEKIVDFARAFYADKHRQAH
jgi:guanylate kinase